MSAIDVLARALWETAALASSNGRASGVMTEAERDLWIGQAEVIAARMIESEQEPQTSDPDRPDISPAEWFNAAADVLHDDLRTDTLTWEDAVRTLATIREGIQQAQNVEANLVRHIYLTGEHGDTELDGLGIVKITRGRDRTKWDERGVAAAIIDQHMTTRAGEMPNDPWEVAEWLLEVFGVSYCRVTPLRALGLDPKAFCEETPGKPSVQFPSLH